MGQTAAGTEATAGTEGGAEPGDCNGLLPAAQRGRQGRWSAHAERAGDKGEASLCNPGSLLQLLPATLGGFTLSGAADFSAHYCPAHIHRDTGRHTASVLVSVRSRLHHHPQRWHARVRNAASIGYRKGIRQGGTSLKQGTQPLRLPSGSTPASEADDNMERGEAAVTAAHPARAQASRFVRTFQSKAPSTFRRGCVCCAAPDTLPTAGGALASQHWEPCNAKIHKARPGPNSSRIYPALPRSSACWAGDRRTD